MTAPVDVSVIVATFGSEEWKWRGMAVAESVENMQSVRPLEVIPRHGVTLATSRNEAALQAKGTWLLFLDGDDHIHHDFLRHMAPHLTRKRTLLNPAVQFILPEGPQRIRCFRPRPLREGNYLVIGTMMRRDAFFQAGGFDPKWEHWEDWPLMWRLVEMGNVIQRVPHAIYQAYWRSDSRNNTVVDPESLRARIIEDFDKWKASR